MYAPELEGLELCFYCPHIMAAHFSMTHDHGRYKVVTAKCAFCDGAACLGLVKGG